MSPNLNPSANKAIPAWHRLPLATRRLLGLLHFRDVGIAAAALLALLIWFDRAQSQLDKLNAANASLNRDVSKMSALAEKKQKIQTALQVANAQVAALRKTGVTASNTDEASTAWGNLLRQLFTGLQINDATISPAPSTSKPAVQTVVLQLNFSAVPDQLTALVNSLANSGQLAHIKTLRAKSDDPKTEKLSVDMQIEAMYFLPDTQRLPRSTPAKP